MSPKSLKNKKRNIQALQMEEFARPSFRKKEDGYVDQFMQVENDHRSLFGAENNIMSKQLAASAASPFSAHFRFPKWHSL